MDQELRDKYEVVIGLEVHAQLKTKSKIFAPDKNEFGQEPNTLTSPITLGMPGVLPVLNKECVNMGILTGLALNCEIPSRCKFDRKQYFYPDLPKGYQISQYDEPICVNGHIEIDGKRIGITRAHLEEDAGKLVHAGANGIAGSTYSLVDLNRAGTPLLEIVSEPDMRSSEEAKNYMEELRNIVRYIGVCDGNLEEGSMRCDANISIMPKGSKEFGTRAEIKNVNSFAALQRAIEYEIERQIEIVEEGGEVVQETRLWDDASRETRSMRGKEDAHDYRYFPEPDLMPLEISREWVEEIRAKMPELPNQKRKRYQEIGLSEYDASVIVEQMGLALFFDKVLELGANPKTAVNFIMGEITAYLKEEHIEITDTKLTPDNLAELISLIEKGTISNNIGKQIIIEMMKDGTKASVIVEKKGLSQISDEGAIKELVQKVVDAHPNEVEAYKNGKTNLLGFFVGQVMKETKGRANPKTVNQLIKEIIG
ncbi:MAG: Asp-tRNA(Asn)/Glu-tRNA(Gln) amidotransferase subunit GatB [Candidatus Gastranaerophilaceae bacterium]|jgi:aspartyl-tRNA(Asn)/glutamyl-tRNA(Gln) amidotransferase subunit B|nr:Asp-tRNA(Asn)/Glu-tRNA(Gln) amidotransferase subunit GatB [bacterium]DAA93906.1 MAG TPA: Asp-tRNA(Asn)/Glu-tRNA(Gln) amidotransferase GatCAB subunit B [Candidatus Gastranaerophilales bacterium HUM_7]